jgi:Response regulator containing CheY-like receiver domain and AraC-type DNA-binding domain
MYKILMADDEGIVLDSLRFILDQNFGDNCQVKTVKSGRAVIEQARQFAPDIAIMDIQMPGINGIEAMKEVRTFNDSIVFIVISAYDKFSFAQEAINLGALDYITKPFAKETVVQAVENAMEVIDRERNKRSKDLLVWEKLQTVVPIIESGFINLILFQDTNSEEMERYRSLLDITAKYGSIMTIEFGEIGSKEDELDNPIGTSVKLQNKDLQIQEIIKEFFPNTITGAIMANKLAFFLPSEEQIQAYEERTKMVDRARNMVNKLNKKLGVSFRAGIGDIWSFDRIHKSYEESRKAFDIGRGSVVHVKDLGLGCDYANDYPIDLETKLFYYVQNGDVLKARDTANQFFDWMVDNYGEYEKDIQTKVLEFVMTAEKEVFLLGRGGEYSFLFRQNYLSEILSCQSYTNLRRWFLDKISEACSDVTTKKREKEGSVIGKAKEYIKQRFSKYISQEEVAKHVDISSYYFSKLFKEEEGMNFIDYVTNLRIDKAKLLLKEGNVSIKEVCLEAGYTDPNYFSRIFKKVVGCTPTEYKEGIEE